jgi:hypothetical protein
MCQQSVAFPVSDARLRRVMNEMQAIRMQIKGGEATRLEEDWNSLGWEIWQLSDGRFVGFDSADSGAPVLDVADSREAVEAGFELLEDAQLEGENEWS